MNQEECCAALLAAGGREYPHLLREGHGAPRAFEFQVESLERCDCNYKFPTLHVSVWECRVQFELFGEKGGYWLKTQIYSVPCERALEMLPLAKRVLVRFWHVYCHEVPAEPCPGGQDLSECCLCSVRQCEKRDALINCERV